MSEAPPGRAHRAAEARGGERADLVRAMFAGIAPRYDLANAVLSLGLDASWRRQVVRALAVRPGEWCLDACCGTGDLAIELARAGARVVGVDFCRPMLERAAAKARGAACFAEGDALRLPLADCSVDAACVAFGLRNLADPLAGLAELRRVVRPSGRIAVLEFSRPSCRAVRAAHGLYTRRVVPLVGDLVAGARGTYRYLPETIGSWFDPEQLATLMGSAGLTGVAFRRLALGAVALHVGVRPAPCAPEENGSC